MTCADCHAEGADCLTADRVRVCSDCLYERVVKERDEARAEVAQWKAKEMRYLSVDRPQSFAAGYQRGAEAMREAAAQVMVSLCEQAASTGNVDWANRYLGISDEVLSLPVPEDR